MPWNLTHLTFTTTVEANTIKPVDLPTMFFPHLESLFLDSLTFRLPCGSPTEHGGDLEEFIITHKATLQKLPLQNCMSEYSLYDGDV